MRSGPSHRPTEPTISRKETPIGCPYDLDIQHTCGHDLPHDLSNRPADKRAGFARWLAALDCTDCWQAGCPSDSTDRAQWLAAKRAEEQQAATECAVAVRHAAA